MPPCVVRPRAVDTSFGPAPSRARRCYPSWTACCPAVELSLPSRIVSADALARPAGSVPHDVSALPATAPSQESAVSAQAVLTALWLAGVLAALARLAFGVRRLRTIAAAATDLDGAEWSAALDTLHDALPALDRVRLCASADIQTPVTFGLLRPVVLLPPEAERWSDDRRRIVLMHELVHVAHRDWAVQIAGQLVRGLYWFHPLAHVAARQLAAERERACDERVIALGAAPSEYASHLLAIALSLPRRGAPAAALAMVRRSQPAQLEGRLMSILETNSTTRAGRPFGLALLSALALSVPALAAIQPRPDPGARAAPHDCPCAAHVEQRAPSSAFDLEQMREQAETIGRLEQSLVEAEELLSAQQERLAALKYELHALRSARGGVARGRARGGLAATVVGTR